MSQVETMEEELTVEGLEGESEKDREAALDLQRIEEEMKKEAERAAAKADRRGNERVSAEAASVAFDFAEAERATEEIEAKRDAREGDGESGVMIEREVLVGMDGADADLGDADWEMDDVWAQADWEEGVGGEGSKGREDREEEGIVELVKESLGDAAKVVKSAAQNAKEQAKELADNIKRQM